MRRTPVAPLQSGWVLVDGLPVYHRFSVDAPAESTPMVHVHGFGISGTYLEKTAALLAPRYRTYVPDLPGMGRSMRPAHGLDLPGLARSLVGYCDAVGLEKATFIGNSLGCPIIIELASTFPERIERVVLVSPAGGPNNQPMTRAIKQMMFDAPREPIGLLPIAVGDYLRFGLLQGLALFKAMTAYPTLERLHNLVMPTLVIAGRRDPLIQLERVHIFADLAHVDAVAVSGAHALNFSRPKVIAALIAAHHDGRALAVPAGLDDGLEILQIPSSHLIPTTPAP